MSNANNLKKMAGPLMGFAVAAAATSAFAGDTTKDCNCTTPPAVSNYANGGAGGNGGSAQAAGGNGGSSTNNVDANGGSSTNNVDANGGSSTNNVDANGGSSTNNINNGSKSVSGVEGSGNSSIKNSGNSSSSSDASLKNSGNSRSISGSSSSSAAGNNNTTFYSKSQSFAAPEANRAFANGVGAPLCEDVTTVAPTSVGGQFLGTGANIPFGLKATSTTTTNIGCHKLDLDNDFAIATQNAATQIVVASENVEAHAVDGASCQLKAWVAAKKEGVPVADIKDFVSTACPVAAPAAGAGAPPPNDRVIVKIKYRTRVIHDLPCDTTTTTTVTHNGGSCFRPGAAAPAAGAGALSLKH